MDLTDEKNADWLARGREDLTDEERRRLGYDVPDEDGENETEGDAEAEPDEGTDAEE